MKSNQYAVICNVTRLASKTGNLEMHTADYEVTQLENVIELIKNIRKH
jgi:N-acetyl-anhydromuramyl-L-alanine amidase AmpD